MIARGQDMLARSKTNCEMSYISLARIAAAGVFPFSPALILSERFLTELAEENPSHRPHQRLHAMNAFSLLEFALPRHPTPNQVHHLLLVKSLLGTGLVNVFGWTVSVSLLSSGRF